MSKVTTLAMQVGVVVLAIWVAQLVPNPLASLKKA